MSDAKGRKEELDKELSDNENIKSNGEVTLEEMTITTGFICSP